VLFTVGMIAFPLLYTIWLSFQSFSSTGRQSFAGLANYTRLVGDNEFWHGLWVTLALYVLSLVLQLVFGRLAGAGAVSRQAIARDRAFAVHLAVHDAAGGRRHDVARHPRSLARRRQLHPDILRPAAVGLAASPSWVIPTVALIDTLAMDRPMWR